jgi:hypothetical protein
VSLQRRKFPFPYRAALAISNDIDGLSYEDFLEIHRFLNTEEETPVGLGLNLDIADSFWFFSARPEINDSFTYFDGLSFEPSRYASAIRLLVETGHLDTLHTWGNFSQHGGFVRAHAEHAARAMEGWTRRPLAWMDHGDEHNLQNLGYGLGDLRSISDGQGRPRKVDEYHADIMTSAGISFVWRTQDCTPIWGIDRAVSFLERARAQTPSPTLPRRLLDSGRNLLRRASQVPLLSPGSLRDTQPINFFQRYLKDWQSTSNSDLATALSEAHLDALEQEEGAVSLLVHFGFGPRFPGFSSGSLSALRTLASRHAAGMIAVMGTARLLLFILARDQAILETLPPSDGLTQYGLRWPEGISRSVRGRQAEAFDGLTFYTDSPDRCRFIFDGESVPVRVNPPDHTGRRSVTVRTWERTPFPYGALVKGISAKTG